MIALAYLLLLAGVTFGSITVDVQQGTVEGFQNENGTTLFFGIPYAAPPVDNLRWRNPQEPLPFSGVFNASQPVICYQNGDEGGPFPMTEDCLRLNIFIPPKSDLNDPVLPVRVWIHGGSLQHGSGIFFGGNKLSIESASIIVTINYRLDIFGFTMFGALLNESTSGNFGFLDQQMALKWVKNNIANFGGDSNNIMIFGESAGGASVMWHLYNPSSWDYYQKAIAESAGPWLFWPMQMLSKYNDAALSEIISQLPCSISNLTCFQHLPADTAFLVLSATLKTEPMIDGVQVMYPPVYYFTNGMTRPNTPILLGLNHDEGNWLATFGPETGVIEAISLILDRSSAELLVSLYNTSEIANETSYADFVGDYYIRCGVIHAAQKLFEYSSLPIYFYQFSHAPESGPFKQWGATHFVEVPWVFNEPQLIYMNFSKEEEELSREMIGLWTNFHQSGDPNQGSYDFGVEWPTYYDPPNGKLNNAITLDIVSSQLSFEENINCEAMMYLLELKSHIPSNWTSIN